jgi:Uma2 family endonuclease
MSSVSVPIRKKFTAEDLGRLSEEDFHYELIEGELQEMTPPGAVHGSVSNLFAAYATIFVEEHELGECFTAETGIWVSRNPDTVLAPDWAFVRKDRVPHPLPEGYLPVIPDLVLETRSPNDTLTEIQAKIQRWLNAGVPMVLEANPKTCELTVYRPGQPPLILGREDTFSGEEVLPGFTLPLRRLFREG